MMTAVTITATEDMPYGFSLADFGLVDPASDSSKFLRLYQLPSTGTLMLNGIPLMLPYSPANASIDIAYSDISKLTWIPYANATGTQGFMNYANVLNADGTIVAVHDLSFNVTGVNDAPVLREHLPGSTLTGETEVRANSIQAGYQDNSSIAALANGDIVETWTGYYQAPDGKEGGVFMRVRNADGTWKSGEVLVNTSTEFSQSQSMVAALKGGGWVVTWTSSEDTGIAEVFSQAYNADGTKMGGETQVNTHLPGDQKNQHVAALSDGGWIVTWESFGQDGNGYGIYARIYDAAGNPESGEIQINTVTSGQEWQPAVAELADGRIVIAWKGSKYPNFEDPVPTIQFQVLNANGTKSGPEMLVTKTSNGGHSPEVCASPEGGWIVAWGGPGSVLLQAYHANGAKKGAEITVASGINTESDYVNEDVSIAVLANGYYVVAWVQSLMGGKNEIHQQVFNENLVKIGEETVVNTLEADENSPVTVVALADGGWMTSWTAIGTGAEGRDIYHRTYHLQEKELTATIGSPFEFQIPVGAFVDPEGDSLTHSLQSGSAASLPGWLSIDPATGTLSGTPPAGADSAILVKITASDGVLSKSDTFTINVVNVNSAPSGADNIISINEDAAHTFSVADFGFSDVNGHALSAVVITTTPGPGIMKLDGATVTAGTTVSADNLGKLTWTPAAEFAGKAQFTFQVVDDGGTSNGGQNTDQSANTITFSVAPVNDAPIADGDLIAVKEDTAKALDATAFLFSDSRDNPENGFAAVIIGAFTGKGKFELSGLAVTAGQRVEAADFGNLVFTPDSNDFGSTYATLTFKAVDDGGTANGGVDTAESDGIITFNVADVVDIFNGTAAKNVLTGTAGRDIFNAKAGNDRISGLAGIDTFVFKTGYDRDLITDFDARGADHDILNLRGLKSITSFADFKKNHAEQSGKDVVIDGLGGDIITLAGVSLKDLDKGDFLF
jgi:hypothetical protein